MISQDEAARTEERLRDALSAAAEIMAESEADAVIAPVPQPAGRPMRGRAWLIPLAAAACVVAVIAASAVLVTSLSRTSSSFESRPSSPGSSICTPLPAAGAGSALPRFYVTTDVTARQIQLQVRRTSDCAITAVVSLPAGWLLAGGISATADDRTFFAAAFSAKSCPNQGGTGQLSAASQETRFFRFSVNGQGRAGRLTVAGPPVSGLVGSIAVSPDGSRIAFNASNENFVAPGGGCTGGEAEGGAVISVIDLASGKIRTWQTLGMPPAPAGTSVTPGAVSWMADGRTLAVSYVWPTSNSGPQLSTAVAALDTNSDGGSLQAHSHVLWSQPKKCVFCVQEAMISPDGKSLTATAIQQTAQGDRNALLQISLPSGRYRVLYESPAEKNSTSATFTQDGSGQHVIVVSASQMGWIRAGKVFSLQAPGSALQFSPGVTTIAW
jgi:WD40-like Beta Propeller Repeat